MKKLLLLTIASLISATSQAAESPRRCLFISSYHQGYAWSDGVERGLRAALAGHCELRQFDMDTKRQKDEAHKVKAAEQARELIDTWSPDVVITADDNAAKYIIAPFYKDARVPFVFSGVNWTAKEYGFPFSNVTGMVEVAPIRPMLEQAIALTPGASSFFYIGADTLTERKNLKRFEAAAKRMNVALSHRLVSSTDAWLSAYEQAQRDHHVVIVGSHSGIDDWSTERQRVVERINAGSRRLSVTNHEWMMPFTMLGMTKIPEEHGQWSGKAAIAILDGMSPSDIPIVANRQWDVWVNEPLLGAAHIALPNGLRDKAKAVQ